MRQRFVFRFWNSQQYKGQEVVITGQHYDDAKSGAWATLAKRTGESNPRESWRLASTEQRPILLEAVSSESAS
jgi:hypothetical protein